MSSSWSEFWQRKNDFDESMIDNYRFFLSKVESYVQPVATSRVLDIGSGPGHLEDAWHNRVAEMHGLDISERYNQIALSKHSNHTHIFFHHLPPDDFLNFSFLRDKKFDIIIVMSVLQYYPNKETVKELITTIQQFAAPGAKLLLCDLVVHEGMLKDLLGILWQSLWNGRLFSMLRFFFKLRFSKYYQIKKKEGFLVIREEEWTNLLNELKLQFEFLQEPITLQKDRKTIMVQF